jgi:hypothetical protein
MTSECPDWLTRYATLSKAVWDVSRTTPHPLVTYYADFPEDRRDSILSTLEDWLRNAASTTGYGFFEKRLQSENSLKNVWSLFSELAIANYVLSLTSDVRWEDVTGQSEPDLSIEVDGRRVYFETKLICHEFAYEQMIDKHIYRLSGNSDLYAHGLSVQHNWVERCRLISREYVRPGLARRKALRDFTQDVSRFEQWVNGLNTSHVNATDEFKGRFLHVWFEERDAEYVPRLQTPLPSATLSVKKVLQSHISSKAKKKQKVTKTPCLLVLDMRTFPLFHNSNEWDWFMQQPEPERALTLPREFAGVIVGASWFAIPSFNVLGLLNPSPRSRFHRQHLESVARLFQLMKNAGLAGTATN